MAYRILTNDDKQRLTEAYAALVEAIKKHKPIWLVYQLTNKSRREMYFGVTSKEFQTRLIEHASGTTETIKHWLFTGVSKDSITAKVIITGKPQEQASMIAHTCEKLLRLKLKGTAWKVHQTGGI